MDLRDAYTNSSDMVIYLLKLSTINSDSSFNSKKVYSV